MKRRAFITLLGGAAAWPVAASAQQPQRMRRIGMLDTLAADDPEASVRHGAFMQGLQELGWGIGRNLRVDTRWAAGDSGRIRSLAAEMVALAPRCDLHRRVLDHSAAARCDEHDPDRVRERRRPVGAGFVASLARPGGNLTGF